ncbi:unnamed protein product [Ixodes pacificus]
MMAQILGRIGQRRGQLRSFLLSRQQAGRGQLGQRQSSPGQLAPGQLAPGQLAPGQLGQGQLGQGQPGPGQLSHRPFVREVTDRGPSHHRCPFCPRVCAYLSDLASHIREVHGH